MLVLGETMSHPPTYEFGYDEDVPLANHSVSDCPECDGRVSTNAHETVCEDCGADHPRLSHRFRPGVALLQRRPGGSGAHRRTAYGGSTRPWTVDQDRSRYGWLRKYPLDEETATTRVVEPTRLAAQASDNQEADPLYFIPTNSYAVINPVEVYAPLKRVLREETVDGQPLADMAFGEIRHY